MSGDHSEVVPLLPIPNRTVKHLSADDSADCPCESRSLPDFPYQKARFERVGLFAARRFGAGVQIVDADMLYLFLALAI